MNGERKIMIISVLLIMLITILGVASYYWYENKYYVSTEDAKITGDIVRVSPQIAGKLLEFNMEEGQMVQKGQILGRQEMINLPDSSLDMAMIKAPISGVVIKKQGTVGEVVSPGQLLGMIVDPTKIYISANIEETKLNVLKPGQQVDIVIDEFQSQQFTGQLKSIGQATASTFSLLPTSTGGNFTKVVQKIPVKIEFTNLNTKFLPGTNAVIKIHVK